MTATSPVTPVYETQPAEPSKRLYKSTRYGTNVIMPSGKILTFKFGRYITNDETEISYLDACIDRNEFGGNIYIDPNARTVTESEENPMKALEKQIIEKYLAEQAAKLDPKQDMGNYTQGTLKTANTSDVASVVANGDGMARLMATAGKSALGSK